MRVLTLLILLTACGQDHGGGSGSEPNVTAQGEQTPEEKKPSEDPTKPGADAKNQYAQLVETAAALPACDSAMNGRLAYVKSDAAFEICGDGAWAVIDLKGASGEKGDKGDKGDVGEKGDAGDDGTSTAWTDPSTSFRWMKAADGNFATALLACDGSFELPTVSVLLAAALHGLSGGLPGNTTAWAGPDQGAGNNRVIQSMDSNPAEDGRADNVTFGIYCVDKTP